MRNLFVFDTETFLFGPGNMAPELVCLTHCNATEPRAHLLNHDEGKARFREALLSDDLIIGHHVFYDLTVMCAADPSFIPLVFKALEEDRITCTKIRMQLADISTGRFRGYLDDKKIWRKRDYSLASLSMRLFKQQLPKDEWRLRYSEFRHVPIEAWPEGARAYPRKDAEITRDIFLQQEQEYGPEILADQFRQCRAYWALQLAHVWGLTTDAKAVDELELKTQRARDEVVAKLQAANLVRADGSRNTKAAKARMKEVMGDNCHLTATGGISLDSEACEASEDPLLEAYAEYSVFEKVLSNDVKMLREGTTRPVHPSYGMADTGRTTCYGPNIQNVRRLPGVREAFRPRPGFTFAQADYTAYELMALAQTCLDLFGESKLAEALNAGLDPHTQVAAVILNKTYEETLALVKAKDHDADMARQTAKVAGFGFPGGLGFARLVDFAHKGYGVTITEDQGRILKAQWFQAWPEMRQFFAHVDTLKRDNGYTVYLPRSKRWRAGASYCAACNSHFQGLAADGAKAALFLVAKACYEPSNPLFGSHLLAAIHDEIILESPLDKAPEAAEELSRLMVQGAKEHMPDMSIRAEPCLMSVWSKMAQTLRDDSGRLIVWSPDLDKPKGKD